MKFLHTPFRALAALMLFLGALVLAACTPGVFPSGTANSRLGTQWGESLDSRVSTVSLVRSDAKPMSVSTLRYTAARPGGKVINELPLAIGQVGMRVVKEDGAAWPLRRTAGGNVLQGKDGERYRLEYKNHSETQTYEIVTTVDGLDVLSGKSGSIKNRGYVLRPGAVLRIDGFRKSADEVAAFRFSSVAESYAANSDAGSVANVGVIGTAVFRLIDPKATTAPGCGDGPCAFPQDAGKTTGGYAPPPNYRN